ncbi:MAG: CPBP family intramembrane glutamic endopeptidase [Rhodanobacter sp.]
MKATIAKWSLRRQLAICAIFCALAAIVILLFQRKPTVSTLFQGLPLLDQFAVGVAAAALYWLATALGSRFASRGKAAQHMAESFSRLDLRGWNPLWIAVAAGVGEELLFRGALQPLLGIWITSILFVLAHIRAYRFDALNKRVLLQSISLFAVSVALGYSALYAGLLTAMIIHVAMDIVGLFAVRRMTCTPPLAPT